MKILKLDLKTDNLVAFFRGMSIIPIFSEISSPTHCEHKLTSCDFNQMVWNILHFILNSANDNRGTGNVELKFFD